MPLGLSKRKNARNRAELIEQDYIKKLSPKEKAWLNKFNEEWISASFDKNNRKNLHKTKEAKRDCYGRNNSRNRDLYNFLKITGNLKYTGGQNAQGAKIVDNFETRNKGHHELRHGIEDKLIEILDNKGTLKLKEEK